MTIQLRDQVRELYRNVKSLCMISLTVSPGGPGGPESPCKTVIPLLKQTGNTSATSN